MQRLREFAPLLLVLVAFSLIIFGEFAAGKFSPFWPWIYETLPKLGWLFLGTGVVNYLYELHGKKEIVRQVASTLGVARTFDKAGLTDATVDIAEIEWRSHIATARKIDLCVSYASTWRSNYVAQLTEFARNKSTKLRIVLPDPDSPQVMDALGRRYSISPDDVKRRVEEAAQFFRSLFHGKAADRLDLRYTESEPTYAYHRFDECAIITMYHTLGKIGAVPVLRCSKGGSFYDLFSRDFESLFASARN
mgnify:CR=1 FL=1